MGSFDLWAWQFLWILGLWFGVKWAKDELQLDVWAKRLFVPALFVVPILFALRIAVGRTIELGSLEVAFDKSHVGGFRLLDAACISALLWRFTQVPRALSVRPLVLLGQASLQVFCAHLLFCFIGLTIMGNYAIVMGWRQLVLLVGTFGGLLLTAKFFSRSENKISPNRPEQSAQLAPHHAES
jgi:hypothetical protein